MDGRVEGGFNGGGNSVDSREDYPYNRGGGGGATDIRLLDDTLLNRIIVAGGGGGGSANYTLGGKGGAGGGVSGENGIVGQFAAYGGGGNQSEGGNSYGSSVCERGILGVGGSVSGYNFLAGGGGGGWFGGGASGFHGGGGGGGSGYVLTASSYKPSGYKLGSEYYLTDAQTIAGNTSFLAPGGGTETGHSGNGYARITVVE